MTQKKKNLSRNSKVLSHKTKKIYCCRLKERDLLFLLSTAPTTCRDGWLGFLFRWRTQQSAISGINCRIIQLPNLWTQKAHGRSSSRVIPVHATSQCRTTKKPPTVRVTTNRSCECFWNKKSKRESDVWRFLKQSATLVFARFTRPISVVRVIFSWPLLSPCVWCVGS